MKRLMHCALVLAMVALFANSALAQMDQGHLTGTVTDAQNAVLPGVTVTATSPALMGSRTAVTEADGRFKIGPVPAGLYTITYSFPASRRPSVRTSRWPWARRSTLTDSCRWRHCRKQ